MIRSVSVLRVRMPLRKHLRLPGVDLEHIESAMVILEEAGRTGVGIFTDISGDSHLTMDHLWRFARGKGGEIIGEDPRWALNHLRMETGRSLMWAAPLILGLEALSDLITVREAWELPLSGPVLENTEPAITEEVVGLLEQGFRTLKIQGGMDVESDIWRVKHIFSLCNGTARIRIDCHQGYSFDDARRFVEAVDTAALELIEQPFPPNEWEQTAAFAEWSPVPIMLDESIQGEGDLYLAASMGCCRYVKCGLSRSYSIAGMIQQIKRVEEVGLQAVVGSDLGSEIQCLYEAIAAASLGVKIPGDMNGFLMQQNSLLEQPLGVHQGCIVLPKAIVPKLSSEKLEPYIVNRIRWAISDDMESSLTRAVPHKNLVSTKRR